MNNNHNRTTKGPSNQNPSRPRTFGPYSNRSASLHALPMSNNAGRSDHSYRPYISDPMIVSRVTQYLESMGKNSVIDFDDMADELQREYREYRRRKRPAFKLHLRKALEMIHAENSLNQDDDDDDSDLIEDEEEIDNLRGRKSPSYALEGDGDVNSTLEDSYLQQNAKKRKTSEAGPQELISIVTSDEDDEVQNTAPETKNSVQPQANDVDAPKKSPAKSKATESQTPKKRKTEPSLPGSKRFKSSLEPVRPTTSFKDIGGNEKVLQEVTQLLVHLRHPEVYRVLGVSPPRGFLLHGPPGSGKTLLAHAISGELKLPLLKVAAPELVGGLSGQSEERIRDLFEQAVALAPCILFIDEVDAITPNRENAHREMERRIVAQLLSCLDELSNNDKGDQVLVIGATNRPDSLDPALRRAGRFDREVCLGIPDRGSRSSILQTLCKTLRLAPELQLSDVAVITPGFVGADLKSLVTEAAMAAVNRLFTTLVSSTTEAKTTPKNEDIKEKSCETTPMDTSAIELSADEGEVTILSDSCKDEKKDDEKPSSTAETQENLPEKAENVALVESGSKCDDVEVQVVPNENEDTSSNDVQVLQDESALVKEGVEGEFAQPSLPPPPPPSLLHSAPLTVEQLQGVFITMEDFQAALKVVQPSAKREGFVTVPDVKWEDIGSLQDIRHDLQMAILAPVKYPEEFAQMGLHTPTGVLLCGPPGCGKTLLAKAVANEAGINFISVKGPELLNMYVGESERAVRQCFQRARSSQPCVIFFDEIDALCPKRNNMESSGASRVVNQLLTEMDGMEARPGVFLMAATNRPDIVDPAVMRPGRLDKVLYVGLPAAEDRVDILRALTKGGKQPLLADDVVMSEVAHHPRCEGYTGADLAALVREASMQALQEYMASGSTLVGVSTPDQLKVWSRHFTLALDKIRPSVSDRDKKRYEDLRLLYAAVPTTG